MKTAAFVRARAGASDASLFDAPLLWPPEALTHLAPKGDGFKKSAIR